ncbi:hypothetical protein HK102_004599 [Quaeritorhiza haematococci]|nr:hypothetical protein HK102_004599 [Quaeritorhiza haematococci]
MYRPLLPHHTQIGTLLNLRLSARFHRFYGTSTNINSVPFFNRKVQVNALTEILHGPPRFTVILGPPSSGKTALVRHVVNQKGVDNKPLFQSLSLDLRGVDVTNADVFKRAFVRATLFSSLRELVAGRWTVHVEAQVFDSESRTFDPRLRTSVEFSSQTASTKTTPPNTVSELFADIVKQLSPYHTLYGQLPPVFVVDEANEFKTLAETDKAVFQDLLRFIVKVSKQESLMHVVFTTSDPFFMEWMVHNQGLPPPHFKYAFLGDLHEADAYEYYLRRLESIVPENKWSLFPVDQDGFRKVFRLTGGRMLFIDEYVVQTWSSGVISTGKLKMELSCMTG